MSYHLYLHRFIDCYRGYCWSEGGFVIFFVGLCGIFIGFVRGLLCSSRHSCRMLVISYPFFLQLLLYILGGLGYL